MATVKNTITKLEKLTGNKINKNTNGEFWVDFNGFTISFYCNGELNIENDAVCFYTKKAGTTRTENDINTDYFPGTFHANATQAFKFINRK
jgi:hypothetical protein